MGGKRDTGEMRRDAKTERVQSAASAPVQYQHEKKKKKGVYTENAERDVGR